MSGDNDEGTFGGWKRGTNSSTEKFKTIDGSRESFWFVEKIYVCGNDGERSDDATIFCELKSDAAKDWSIAVTRINIDYRIRRRRGVIIVIIIFALIFVI